MAVEEHPEIQVFDEIGLIEAGIRTIITRCLPAGVSFPQFEVMNLLARRGEGLSVVVADCEDRRKKRGTLTAKGRQAYQQAMAAVKPRMASLREGFTQKEFREVLPFLRALRAWMEDTARAPA